MELLTVKESQFALKNAPQGDWNFCDVTFTGPIKYLYSRKIAAKKIPGYML